MTGLVVPFVTPHGIESRDVPWLADLIARHAVRLFDPRQLHDLTLSVSAGPNCTLHTAQLLLLQGQPQPSLLEATASASDAIADGSSGATLVAIKQYHRPADLIFEVHQLLVTPPSQHINPLLGIVQLGDQGLTCLVVPYHPLGNLRRYIADQRANLTALQQMQIIHDIASGLEFLHQRGIQHLNLHTANVLISLQGMAVLTDIGRVNNRAEVGMPPKPTAELERIRSLAAVFLAPEVLASNSYSSRSEVYALGMIMFELLTGRVAFEKDLSQPGLSTRIMFGRQDEIPANLKASPGPAYEALIKDCWKLNPAERPHLSGLKSRLEQLMAECRQQSEVLKVQQQVSQLQQQQLYQQQQQAQYNQPYQPGSIAPPTPPLPDTPVVDPMLKTNAITARYAANTSAAARPAATTAVNFITTTQIIVSDTVRLRSDSGAKAAKMEDAAATTLSQKPVEAWTIGQATAPVSHHQRDAIPIPTRAMDMTSGHLRAKSISIDQQQQLIAIPQNSVPIPGSGAATVIIATAAAVATSSAQSYPVAPVTPSMSATGSEASYSSSTSPAWPITPPTMATTASSSSYLPAPTVFTLNADAAASAMVINTGARSGSSIPLTALTGPAGQSGTTATTVTPPYPVPPQPARSNSTNSDLDFIPRAYAVSGVPSPTSAAVTKPVSPTSPISIPIRTTSALPGAVASSTTSTSTSASAISPASPLSDGPLSPSPSNLFNPGRNTILATAAAEQKHQHDPMPTFFNWRQAIPRIPSGSDQEVARKISSASSVVQVVPGDEVCADTETNKKWSQDQVQQQQQRKEKVKSFVATIEPAAVLAAEVVPPMPVGTSQQQQTMLPQVQNHQQAAAAVAVMPVSGKKTRESALIIPAFPEPPSTLHNRRISTVKARLRQVTTTARQEQRGGPSHFQIHGRTGSSGDESGGPREPRSPTVTTAGKGINLGATMAPQESGPGTSGGAPAIMPGLTTRGSYTPILSSEDVPTGAPSDCIFSAARNGDLIELQQFLNKALSRSLSNGSSSTSTSMSMGSGSMGKAPSLPVSDILDEFEPIERLPVLCCAAVARKNKYQALNMVLKAGANVAGKEQRGGNTPLHLVCETAPPPVEEPTVIRYKQDEHGSRIRAESVVDLLEEGGQSGTLAKMSQMSLLEGLVGDEADEDGALDGGADDEDEEQTEKRQAAALRKVDEQDDQEQEALERVKEDSESLFSLDTNPQGLPSLSTRQQSALGGPYYQMKNHILMKGGLEDQIRLLVLAGAPVDACNCRGETPLLLLLRLHDSVTAMATLLKLGADPLLMAPFGPGTHPPEILMENHSGKMTSKEQKRASKKLFSAKSITLKTHNSHNNHHDSHGGRDHDQQTLSGNNDPNHILIMHGSALAQAAYYLRIQCVRYLLEHEIECSDPAIVEQAVVACKQSTAAKVNPQLVALQQRILLILERDWSGARGRKRRVRVAERTLNRKRKPVRTNVLLKALAVSSTDCSIPSSGAGNSTSDIKDAASSSQDSTCASGYSKSRGSRYGRVSATFSRIPTTHLYTKEGPSGQAEIELISHHGFMADPSVPRFQLTDRPMPPGFSNGGDASTPNGRNEADHSYGYQKESDPKNPRLGQGHDPKGILKKIRNMTKRT
ncbi:hypothetical protein EDD11_003516 [Mortierella claussenii]|nr:hypothetical protein EDD11_003516 [Mortierella claussenii]